MARKRPFDLTLLIALFLLAAGMESKGAVALTTLTLTPSADTSIISDGENPKGDQTILAGTRLTGALDRGLIQFDLSSIPTNALIDSVTLHLTVVMVPGTPADSRFELFRMLTKWDESANWSRGASNLAWAGPGATAGRDYIATPSAGRLVEDLGDYAFGPSAELAGDVQWWIVHPAENWGWLLKSDKENVPGSARHFGSRESVTKPQLTVQYSLPPQAPRLNNVAAANGQFTFSFEASPNHVYEVETQPLLKTTGWFTLTNPPAPPAPSPIVISTPLQGPAGFFRVRVD